MIKFLVSFLLLAVIAIGCGSQQDAIRDAQDKAQNRNYYLMKNDVEYKNYARRQQLADDPTAILWCTVFPKNTAVEPFTVPIQGKLTSSSKRPFAESSGIGPDAMYGSSVEYRYGWTPGGLYVDFTGLDTFCTTDLTIFQRDATTIVVGPAESNPQPSPAPSGKP